MTASSKPPPRRPRGTGSLFLRRDSAGREVWYGKWWAGTTQIKRRIGPNASCVRSAAVRSSS